jgi:hypothetical protein
MSLSPRSCEVRHQGIQPMAIPTGGTTSAEDHAMLLGPEEDEPVEVVDDHRNPSEVTDDYWLYCCRIPSRFQASGKWMLFYRADQIDAAWARARELYMLDEFTVNRASPLGGVSAMKVRTAGTRACIHAAKQRSPCR